MKVRFSSLSVILAILAMISPHWGCGREPASSSLFNDSLSPAVQAFVRGNSVLSEQLADRERSAALGRGDGHQALQALIWTGVCQAARGEFDAADKIWQQSGTQASQLSLFLPEMKVFALRAALWRVVDPKKSFYFFNQCLQSSRSGRIPPIDAALELLLLGESVESWQSEIAYEQIVRLLEPTQPSSTLLAVAWHNLALKKHWRGIRSFTDNDCLSEARALLEQARHSLATSGRSPLIDASITLHLARAAAYEDDRPALNRYSTAFRALVDSLPSEQLENYTDLLDAALLTSVHDPNAVTSLRSTELQKPSYIVSSAFSNSNAGSDTALLDPVYRFGIEAYVRSWLQTQSHPKPSRTANPDVELAPMPPGIAEDPDIPDYIKEQLAGVLATARKAMADGGYGSNTPSEQGLDAQARARQLAQSVLTGGPENERTKALILGQLPYGDAVSAQMDSLSSLIPASSMRNIEKRNWENFRASAFASATRAADTADASDASMIPDGFIENFVSTGRAISLLADPSSQALGWRIIEDGRAMGFQKFQRLIDWLKRPEFQRQWEDFYDRQRSSVGLFINAWANIDREMLKASGQFDQFVRALELDFATGTQPPPEPSLADAAGAIPHGSVFITFVGALSQKNSQLYTLMIPSGGTEIVVERASHSPIAPLFRRRVIEPGTREIQAVDLGRRLYNDLFPGVIGRAIAQADKVILSPSRDLWDFPFAALVMNESGNPEFLGLEKPISYIGSLTQLRALQQRRCELPLGSRPKILIVGGCDYESPDRQITIQRFNKGPISNLPFSMDEAREVANCYDARAITGSQATEVQVRRQLGAASVIHFASHGFPDNSSMTSAWSLLDRLTHNREDWPGLWLTPSNQPNPGFSSDGLIQAWEIAYYFDLNAEVAVLSGCYIGGTHSPFSAAPHLPMAFLNAGARSVLAGQVAIHDDAAAILMPEFHRYFHAGYAKDEALRLALVKLRNTGKFSHPAYWSPFILSGDSENRLFTRN